MQYTRNHYKKEACALCEETDNLHLHHIVPAQWGGSEYYPNEVITLCQPCHMKIHKRLSAVLTPEYRIKIFEQHKLEILWLAQSTLIKKRELADMKG